MSRLQPYGRKVLLTEVHPVTAEWLESQGAVIPHGRGGDLVLPYEPVDSGIVAQVGRKCTLVRDLVGKRVIVCRFSGESLPNDERIVHEAAIMGVVDA